MMIDFGKPEIFEWQMSQAIHRFVRCDCALLDLLEQLADGFGVQEALASPAVSRANLRLTPAKRLTTAKAISGDFSRPNNRLQSSIP